MKRKQLEEFVGSDLMDVTQAADSAEGWYEIASAYAPELPNEYYRVAIVILEIEDDE